MSYFLRGWREWACILLANSTASLQICMHCSSCVTFSIIIIQCLFISFLLILSFSNMSSICQRNYVKLCFCIICSFFFTKIHCSFRNQKASLWKCRGSNSYQKSCKKNMTASPKENCHNQRKVQYGISVDFKSNSSASFFNWSWSIFLFYLDWVGFELLFLVDFSLSCQAVVNCDKHSLISRS